MFSLKKIDNKRKALIIVLCIFIIFQIFMLSIVQNSALDTRKAMDIFERSINLDDQIFIFQQITTQSHYLSMVKNNSSFFRDDEDIYLQYLELNLRRSFPCFYFIYLPDTGEVVAYSEKFDITDELFGRLTDNHNYLFSRYLNECGNVKVSDSSSISLDNEFFISKLVIDSIENKEIIIGAGVNSGILLSQYEKVDFLFDRSIEMITRGASIILVSTGVLLFAFSLMSLFIFILLKSFLREAERFKKEGS